MAPSKFTMVIKDHKVAQLGPKRLQINLTRLSHTTGYSLSHLSRIFRKESNPSVRCLESVAKALGMEMGDLHKAIKERKVNVTT